MSFTKNDHHHIHIHTKISLTTVQLYYIYNFECLVRHDLRNIREMKNHIHILLLKYPEEKHLLFYFSFKFNIEIKEIQIIKEYFFLSEY